jgi:nitroreductase
MRLTSENFATLVERANLAPSVHNTQLTRWRLSDDGSVLVLEDPTRRLPVADPAGRDAAVSHGAAIEGFRLACADAGSAVDVERLDGPDEGGLRPVARLTLRDGGQADPLSTYVATRRSYRGTFAKRALPANLDTLSAAGDVVLVQTAAGLARLAELNDEGALRTYRDRPYREELRSWLRLSRRHPQWALDGLNAEEMAMSGVTAAGAALVMARFELLDRIGVASALVAEAAVIRSAKAIALLHRPASEDPFLTGRRFYRLWLEFTALGLSAAPMSVLADDEDIRATIAREFSLPEDHRLINAFRLGIPPPRNVGPKPRLPRSTLVVQS